MTFSVVVSAELPKPLSFDFSFHAYDVSCHHCRSLDIIHLLIQQGICPKFITNPAHEGMIMMHCTGGCHEAMPFAIFMMIIKIPFFFQRIRGNLSQNYANQKNLNCFGLVIEILFF